MVDDHIFVNQQTNFQVLDWTRHSSLIYRMFAAIIFLDYGFFMLRKFYCFINLCIILVIVCKE